ncbi:ParB/RepB/Spo0J family partition protein [Kitasatospora sp. NPDC048540]|uniref:ParB/RepB/Spo0J family partition protein n=1 Tax=unclassified Kitasatospora TaxID=2633591 RepID=UPI00068E6434|nr:ParB/RepB/Spo0J family partition protein [Kitasatospora sp. MBT63]
MSVAKKLAAGGGAFGALAQSELRGRGEVVARSEALDATGRVRRASLAPVDSIVFNPLNPRKTIVDSTIDELGESLRRQQIVPVTVVSRSAYLDAHPEQAAKVGNADFVALDGNRRLLAAQRVGLANLRVDLNDDLVSSASDMVEAALVANAHREGVLPFEEAQAIDQLLTTVYDGNQAAVARKLGKSRAWVGQRLALLHLAPELQEQAGAGELAIEDARKIGARARAGHLSAAEQLEMAEAAKQAAAAREAAKAAAKSERSVRGPGPAAAPTARAGGEERTVVAPQEPREAEPDVNAVYTEPGRETDPSRAAADRDVNAVYTGGPEQRDVAEVEAGGTVTVQFDPSDFIQTARRIREAMDVRQAVNVTSALLAILQREPEFPEIMESIRGRMS